MRSRRSCRLPRHVHPTVPPSRHGHCLQDLAPERTGLRAEPETAVAGGPLYLQIAGRTAAGLAFIYDRPTGSTPGTARALIAARVAACRLWAEERGYDLAGEWVEEDASEERPRFQAMVSMLRVHAERRPVLCLVNNWDRLHVEPRLQQAYARRVQRAGGWTETAAGETTRSGVLDPLLTDALAEFWGDGR